MYARVHVYTLHLLEPIHTHVHTIIRTHDAHYGTHTHEQSQMHTQTHTHTHTHTSNTHIPNAYTPQVKAQNAADIFARLGESI